MLLSSTKDITSRHSSSASTSSSDQEESEAETDTDRPEESDHEETAAPPEQQCQPDPETSEVGPKDSEVKNSAEDSTDVTICDSSGPSRAGSNPSADTEVGQTPDESKREEDLARSEWKSAITATSG